MAVEKFTPNEFVADCWYVKAGSCYSTLFYDVTEVGGRPGYDGMGENSLSSRHDESKLDYYYN